jgi:hypothetical protein
MNKTIIEEGDRVKVINGAHQGCEGKVTYITKTKSGQSGCATVHLQSKNGIQMYDDQIYATFKLSDLESLENAPANELQEQWETLSNEYMKQFCEKHGYRFEPDSWVGIGRENIGTTAEICDMFVHIDDMRYDIDNNIPESKFEEWYWKSLEIYELTEGGEKYMNYPSFCKGAPDYWTEERMQDLRDGARRVKAARESLENEIASFKANQKRWKETEKQPVGHF